MFGQCLKKLNVQLPYDPAIPLLYLPKRKGRVCPYKDLSTNITAALLFNSPKLGKKAMAPHSSTGPSGQMVGGGVGSQNLNLNLQNSKLIIPPSLQQTT